MACLNFIEKVLPNIVHSHTELVAEFLDSMHVFRKHKHLPCRRKFYEILMFVYDADEAVVRSVLTHFPAFLDNSKQKNDRLNISCASFCSRVSQI